MNIVIAVVAGVVGMLIGGVINALADDLPNRQTPRLPHYPDGTPRPVSVWLGVTAFLTGRRESPCASEAAESSNPDESPPITQLGWRYPLVEIVAALVFAWMAVEFADEKNLLAWLVYVAILLLITVIDIEHRLILFVVILPSCMFALLVAAISPEGGKPFGDFLIGGLVGFVLFFAMFLGGVGFSMVMNTGEIAFGFGDVMLATFSGFMLGWRAFIFASLIAVFAGALGAVFYLGARAIMRQRYKWFTPLPYGPYIVLGTLILLLFRDEVGRLLGAN
jgi:leader peptidase (prepilin peptidase)/N-methyltransferase